jgi:hypothetical protein
MGNNANKKRSVMVEMRELAPLEFERPLMEEINILRLEGTLFCFDPKEAKRRRGALTLVDARKQPVSIKIDADYGQPSVLAYKVLQAIFLKLTEQGCTPTEDGRCLHTDTVSFSARELAHLAGRSSWGGSASKQLHQAMMQLQGTRVIGSMYSKVRDEWETVSFVVLPTVYFASREQTITRCAVQLHSKIIESINRRHIAFFNLHRLNQLDTLGLVLYKRVFFHLSNLMHDHRSKGSLKYTKDYESICREWLGGLKPEKYRSRIISNQLGRHLDDLITTGLIRCYMIEENKARSGFNISFHPGAGFFEDYEEYYSKQAKPRRIAKAAELSEVKALELVAYFHRKLGRATHMKFQDHETTYADELLATYGEAEVRALIDHAIAEAAKTKFEMLFFGALKRYVAKWAASRTKAVERARRARVVANCPFCNKDGLLQLREKSTGCLLMHPCPHRLEQVSCIEERFGAFRFQS